MNYDLRAIKHEQESIVYILRSFVAVNVEREKHKKKFTQSDKFFADYLFLLLVICDQNELCIV